MLGLLWYLLSIVVWCLVGGVLAGGLSQFSHPGDVVFGIAIIAFFNISWWLPYVSYVAVTEKLFSIKLPQRSLLFFVFMAAGFAVLTLSALSSKDSGLWPLKIIPAVAVTILYFIRRQLRKTLETAPAEQGAMRNS